jgi:hypothetical protein
MNDICMIVRLINVSDGLKEAMWRDGLSGPDIAHGLEESEA